MMRVCVPTFVLCIRACVLVSARNANEHYVKKDAMNSSIYYVNNLAKRNTQQVISLKECVYYICILYVTIKCVHNYMLWLFVKS